MGEQIADDLHDAVALLRLTTRFELRPRGARVEYRGPGDAWAVLDGSDVLNRDGAWEWEPTPSSRDDAFKARVRFPLAEALARAGFGRLGAAAANLLGPAAQKEG